MRFAMADSNYVGTPNITVVTPEKSTALNFFCMTINYPRNRTSLRDIVVSEPMFIEDFRLEKKLVLINSSSDPYIKARLKGSGLRRRADVWVGNRLIPYRELNAIRFYVGLSSPGFRGDVINEYIRLNPQAEFVTQIDTGEYFLHFARLSSPSWPVRFRQNTIKGFDADEFVHKISKAGEFEVHSYTPNSKTKKALLDVRFFGAQPGEAQILPPGKYGRRLGDIFQDGDDVWRALFEIKYEDRGSSQVERDKIAITVIRGASTTTHDIAIPVRPQITAITITKDPIAEAKGSLVTIEGINLQNVAKVFVADREATIVGQPANDSLVVKLNEGAFIKEEDGVKIPVVLITKEGARVSGVVTIGKPAKPQQTTRARRPKKSA
jgi:hypothetical protein